MGRKGFSGTTLVMVAVLIFALFMVGKMVNPAPPGPPEPPKPAAHVGTETTAAAKADPKAQQAMIKDRVAKMKQQMMEEHAAGKNMANAGKASSVKKFDPNTIDVTPTYFGQNDDGVAGTQKLDEKVAKAKAEQAAERARINAQKGTPGAPLPVSKPHVTPMPGANP